MTMIALGIALSCMAAVLLLYLTWDCRRRADAFSAIRIGGRTVAARWVRRSWMVVLVAAFLVGVRGYPVRTVRTVEPPTPTTTAQLVATKRTEVRIPFLVRTASQAVYEDGDRQTRWREMTLQIPWIFLLFALVHWVLAARLWRRDAPVRD